MKPALIMTCDLERDAGSRDAMGGGENWQILASNVACYWWAAPGSVGNAGEVLIASEVERVMLDRCQDVSVGDRIVKLVDHLGRTVFEDEDDYRVIEHVTPQRNHLDCVLSYAQITGGRR